MHKAKLLFIGCIIQADDEWRLQWNIEYLKWRIFMYDNISTEKVISLVCELVTKMKNFIRYEVYEKEEIAN